MDQPKIICPNCSTEIPLTESLAAPLLQATREEFKAKIKEKESEVARRLTGAPQHQVDDGRYADDMGVAADAFAAVIANCPGYGVSDRRKRCGGQSRGE